MRLYRALRRKVGGTARDFWKGYIEEEQVKNIKTYYKPGESAQVWVAARGGGRGSSARQINRGGAARRAAP